MNNVNETNITLTKTRPPLRDVIARYGLAARKNLGQHFLLDLNLTKKIVAAAGDLDNTTVFEIGPGPGGLTRALLESNAKKIIAIEKDPRCVAALQELRDLTPEKLDILEADALTIDLTTLAPAPRAVVANLPYNVATPMLIGWLKQMATPLKSLSPACPPKPWRRRKRGRGSKILDLPLGKSLDFAGEGEPNSISPKPEKTATQGAIPAPFESLTLMFQAEVVDRLIAKPNTKAYGRLSVMTQFTCDARRVMTLPARAFTPPPKVDSAVVRLTPRHNRPQDITFEAMETVTAAAFNQRRKMLRSSLKSLGGETLLEKAGIDPQRRAEELTIQEYEKLATLI